MSKDVLTFRISEAKEILHAVIKQNIELKKQGCNPAELNTPYLISEPGIGKTSIVEQVAKELGIGFQQVILAQYDPADLGGMPYLTEVPGQQGFKTLVRARPHFMPTTGSGILFLDELTQSFVSNQNIAGQIVNEHCVGEHVLPEGWVVVVASNDATNRAGTNPMPTQLKDRLMWMHLIAYYEDTVSHFNRKGLSDKICAYLRYRPEFLSKFDPKEDICPSPRSWEKCDKHVQNEELSREYQAYLFECTVGRAAAKDFNAFLEVWGRMPDPDQVLADPDNAVVPKEQDVLYALTAALSARANETNAPRLIRYAERLVDSSGEYAIYMVRDAIDRTGGCKSPLATRCAPVKDFLRTHIQEMYELYAPDDASMDRGAA